MTAFCVCLCAYQQDVKRLATIKQQLESYKRQTLELQNRLTDETKRADKWEFEFNRIQEKFAIQQREKEVGLAVSYTHLTLPTSSYV